jgi:hypothetical protein
VPSDAVHAARARPTEPTTTNPGPAAVIPIISLVSGPSR